VQLARLEAEFIPARRALAARYREGLAGVPGIAFLRIDPADYIVPHILPVRVLHGRKNAARDTLADGGIPTGVHYRPNHLLTYYGGGAARLPATEQLYGELLTLPLHPGLSGPDVDGVCAALRSAL
jgi:dTDP-4-amino-4,6-dideoxygalactose transaminase